MLKHQNKLKITIFKRKRKFTQKNAATDIKFSNIQTHTHTQTYESNCSFYIDYRNTE